MKHEILFTFGDDKQYVVIDTECVGCRCEFSFIDETGAMSLPICLACENALKACKRELDKEEG